MFQYAELGDTVYFWFAANDTSGSSGDGASAVCDVREAGAAASAAPTLSPTPSLLSHVNYNAGAYEVAVAATSGNGFSADKDYGVFCSLAIDLQNPLGFVGGFRLTRKNVGVGALLTETTIATLTSQTNFTLTDGSADDNAYNNCRIVVTDATTATQKARGTISNYTGLTKRVTLSSDPGIFPMAVGDKVEIIDGRNFMSESMTEGYPVDGQSAVTPEQALYGILQALTEFSRSGTTITVKERDATTTAFTLTLDSGTAPTSSTQAT